MIKQIEELLNTYGEPHLKVVYQLDDATHLIYSKDNKCVVDVVRQAMQEVLDLKTHMLRVVGYINSKGMYIIIS